MTTKNATCEVCKKRHLRFYVTAIQPWSYLNGSKCRVVIKCSACGYVDEITDLVQHVSPQYLDDLLTLTPAE